MKLRLSAPRAKFVIRHDGNQSSIFVSGMASDGNIVQAEAHGVVAEECDRVISSLTNGGLGLNDVFIEFDGGWVEGDKTSTFNFTQFMVLKGAALEIANLRRKSAEAVKIAKQLIEADRHEAASEILLSFANSLIDAPSVSAAPKMVAERQEPTPPSKKEKKQGGFAAFGSPVKAPAADTPELDAAELQAVAENKTHPAPDDNAKTSQDATSGPKLPSFGKF